MSHQHTSTATCNGVAPDVIDLTWEAQYSSNRLTLISLIVVVENFGLYRNRFKMQVREMNRGKNTIFMSPSAEAM